MIKSYFKLAFRNLLRNKAFSFINIFGLAVGLATCLLILLYIIDECGYDKQFRNGDRVYRIAYSSSKAEPWAGSPAPWAWGMKAALPEVEQVTRLLKFPDQDKMMLKPAGDAGTHSFYETNGFYADSTFFDVMPYPFIYGNPATALSEPSSAVLSETTAEKLFGKTDPIGKVISVGLNFGATDYTVKGVYRDKGVKSHIPARFLLSLKGGPVGDWVSSQTNWVNNNIFFSYARLKPGVDPQAFTAKLQHLQEQKAGVEMKAMGITKNIFIQPLRDIYLRSQTGYEIAVNGNEKYLFILGTIAVFVLLIACINFMNLSTARSGKRAREVGVRKVMGAGKGMLIGQFLGESFFFCLLSLALALLLAQLGLPLFNQLTGKTMTLLGEPSLLLWITALTLLTGLFSGLYPAFYLSAFRPVKVLKGRFENSFSGIAIRKGLVVFQFAISICLVSGAIVIWQQLTFMQNQNLGFTKDQELVLPLHSPESVNQYAALKDELGKVTGVKSVTNGSAYPGIVQINDALFYAEGKTAAEATDINVTAVGPHYEETLGLTRLAGRGFYPNIDVDSNNIIFTETAIRHLGLNPSSAVGKKVRYDYQNVQHTVQIVGVIKDYHFQSLHEAIKPMGLATRFFANPLVYGIVRIQPGNLKATINDIRKTWLKTIPGSPFEYSFVDQDFQKNYESDRRTAGIIGYFTIMAIVIAALGLFGLSAFSAEQRTKEIGVRKVLGASVSSIIRLLSREYVFLLLIAILIAVPVSWYATKVWLRDFAYTVPVHWWMFAAAGMIALVVALVTVSFQAIKAAMANPVRSMRTE